MELQEKHEEIITKNVKTINNYRHSDKDIKQEIWLAIPI